MSRPNNIDEIKARWKKTTPAPWRSKRQYLPSVNPWFEEHCKNRAIPIESTGTQFALGCAVAVVPEGNHADAAAIAAAPEDIAFLLKLVSDLEKKLRRADILAHLKSLNHDP